MESPTVTTTRLTVRFEDSCVLIPPSEPSKPGLRPRLITRSYSLPLWKATPTKKTLPAPVTPEAGAADGDKGDKKAFSVTIQVPRLTIKSKPGRRPSLPPSPCLSKRSPSTQVSPVSHPSHNTHEFVPPPTLLRTPSFPAIQPASVGEAATVPLRPCCVACHSCVDAALAEGERWAEKWSLGARRRYSEGEHMHSHTRPFFGVTREWKPKGPDMPLSAALQVDEVEVKRRSSDAQRNVYVPEDALADSDEESAPPPIPPPPVQEEDADMLFPLPSPRRSPNASPYATPLSGSQVSLTTMQAVLDKPQTPIESPLLASAPAAAAAPPPTPAQSESAPPPGSSIPGSPSHDPSVDSQVHVSETRKLPHSDDKSPTRPRAASLSTPRPRRLSFSSASGSLLKGSAAVLKGVAAGMVGSAVGVVR